MSEDATHSFRLLDTLLINEGDHRQDLTCTPPAWTASEIPDEERTYLHDLQHRLGNALSERNYDLLEQIGSGGWGVVYKAQKNQKNYAVKVLKHENPLFHDLFLNEIQLHTEAAAAHQSVLRIYDHQLDPGLSYFIMELAGPLSLEDVIKDHDSYWLRDRISMVVKVATILKELHEHGKIHRDIKPGNILFSCDSRKKTSSDKHYIDGAIRLADFGIAARVGAIDHDVEVGTIAYLAPEQVSFPLSADQRSDIYSLAVVTYELLAGKTPRDIQNITILDELSRETTPPLLPTIDPAVNTYLQNVLRRSLNTDPDKRHQSMSDFHEDLADFLTIYDLGVKQL